MHTYDVHVEWQEEVLGNFRLFPCLGYSVVYPTQMVIVSGRSSGDISHCGGDVCLRINVRTPKNFMVKISTHSEVQLLRG